MPTCSERHTTAIAYVRAVFGPLPRALEFSRAPRLQSAAIIDENPRSNPTKAPTLSEAS